MGTITFFILKREFEEKVYPFEITNGMGIAEFVATSANYRGQCVIYQIIG